MIYLLSLRVMSEAIKLAVERDVMFSSSDDSGYTGAVAMILVRLVP